MVSAWKPLQRRYPIMNDQKKKMFRYLLSVFVIAYIIQFAAAGLYRNGQTQTGQLVIAAMMFVPLLSVILSGSSLKGMGWKPVLKGNMKLILTAWFLPAVLTALGTAIYFLIFPGHFDLSGAILNEAAPNALEALEAQGITYPMCVLITSAGCLTYAPLINMFPAVGEEAGWRGYLYPELKKLYGRKKGILLGGVIWGAWHWPLIWLIGYEYGIDYPGFPVTGMVLFCIFTVCGGVLHDVLYEKSRCIWIPAVFHGALNAAATIPLAICRTDTGPARLLGPAPNGLIAGLPLMIAAVIIMCRTDINSYK